MIDFVNVSKKYEGEEEFVINHFNLHIDRGEIVALTGSSGIGKTTLIKLLLKDIEPTFGDVIVDGKKLSSIDHGRIPYYRRQIGVVFQDYKLIPKLNAYENVKAAMLGVGAWNSKTGMRRISSIFSMLGISQLHNKMPHQMSGGEQQRVCIARAIVNYPQILVADEPTGNLDPASSEDIFRLLKTINDQGITVVLSTHNVELVRLMNWREIKLCEENVFTKPNNKNYEIEDKINEY